MVQKYPDAKNEANKTNQPDREKDKQSSSISCPFMQNHRQLYLRKVKNLASIKELLVLDEKQVYPISVSDISPKICETCGKAIGNEGKTSASTQVSDFSSEITICREFATGTREAVRDSSCEAVCLAVCSRRPKNHSKKTSSSEDKSGTCYCEESILSQESLPYWVVQRRQKLRDDESVQSQKYIQTQASDFTPTDSTLHKFVCKADCCKGGICPNTGCDCPYKKPPSESTGDFNTICACSQSISSNVENKKPPPQASQTHSTTVSSTACSCNECLCSTNIDVSLNVSMQSSKEDKPSIDIGCECANCICSSNASICQSKASETEAVIVEKRVDNLAKGELGTLGIISQCSNIECIYSNSRFVDEIKLNDSNEDQYTPSDCPEIDINKDVDIEDAIGLKSKTLIGPIRNAIYSNMQTLESLDVFKAVLVKDKSNPMKTKPKAQPSKEAIAPGYRNIWVDTVKEQSLIPLPVRSNLMIFPSGVALYQKKSKEQQKSGKILTDTDSVRQACTAALCKAVWLAIQNTDKPINLVTSKQCNDICSKNQPKSNIKISEKTVEDIQKVKQTLKPIKIPQKAVASDLIKNNRSVSKTKLDADTGRTSTLSSSKAKLGIDSKPSRTKLGNNTKTRQSKEGIKRTDICRPTASTFNRTRTTSPPVLANTNKEHAKKEKTQAPSSKIHTKGSGVVYKEPTKAKEKDQKGRGKVKEDMSPRDGKVCLSKPKICPAIHQNKDEFPGIIRAEVEENVTFGDIGNSFILCSVCSTMSQATSALCVAVPQKGTPIFPTHSFCDKNEGTVELQVRSPPEMRIMSEHGSPTSSKGFVCSFPAKICPIGSVSHNGSPVTLVSDTDGVAQDNESGFKMPEDLAVICSGCGFWHKLYKFPTIQEMKAFTPLQLASLCQCDSCNCKVCWNKPKSPSDKNPVIENVWPESPRSPKKSSNMDCGCTASKEKHNNSNKCDCTKCSLVAMKKEIESLRKKLTVLINGNKDTKSYKLTPSWTKVNQEATFKRTNVIKKPAVTDIEKKKPFEVISKKIFVHPKAASRQSKELNRIPSERSSRTSSLFITNNYSLRDTRKGVVSSTAAVTLKTPSDSKPKKKATNSKTGKGVPKEWYKTSWK